VPTTAGTPVDGQHPAVLGHDGIEAAVHLGQHPTKVVHPSARNEHHPNLPLTGRCDRRQRVRSGARPERQRAVVVDRHRTERPGQRSAQIYAMVVLIESPGSEPKVPSALAPAHLELTGHQPVAQLAPRSTMCSTKEGAAIYGQIVVPMDGSPGPLERSTRRRCWLGQPAGPARRTVGRLARFELAGQVVVTVDHQDLRDRSAARRSMGVGLRPRALDRLGGRRRRGRRVTGRRSRPIAGIGIPTPPGGPTAQVDRAPRTVRPAHGKAADKAIASQASDANTSVLCLSTHGTGGLGHIALGSLALSVVHHARAPSW
jgi:nucleotide-binding universal stress UspA family protein